MKLRLTLAVLVLAHLAIALAPWLAPYDYSAQNRDYPYAPPTRLHFIDAAGRFHLRPFVYGQGVEASDCSYPIEFMAHGRLFGVASPGVIFLLGTDALGRDVFSRVLYGGRLSLLTGLIATLISLGIGLILGILAGFHGGWVDGVLMRGGELFMALPWLYLLLAAI
ncbi:MAG: ABC transporter permease, partial [Candidatus Solibacter sp.]